MNTTSPSKPPHEPEGVASSLSRLKRDGGHSIAELQQFLAQMRGRSPQEVLGMVSASGLVRGIAMATVGCAVLMAVFTIGPYLWPDDKSAAKQATEKAAPVEQAQPEEKPKSAVASATPDTSTAEPDLDAAAKALNIDEVKTADPNVNPLDKDLDKLLDGEK